MKNIFHSLTNYYEFIKYFIVGICTTIISLSTKYILLFFIFSSGSYFHLQLSIIISWILSVMFSYLMNRKIVFKSKCKNILNECSKFIIFRIFSLCVDSFILWFLIIFLGFNEKIYIIFSTLFSEVVIFVLNYLLSKFLVFSYKY